MVRKTELLNLSCPIAIAQNVIAGKWKILIVWRLKDGVIRFNELQKLIPNIAQSTLTQQLKELERDGLIHREVYKVIPPKVEYSLTNMGEKFLKATYKFAEWALEYVEYLKN